MNYEKIYQNLISKCKVTNYGDSYVERHHIVPRCIGGSDDSSNIVIMNAAEHFLAHQLLAKIYPNHDGLIYACIMMCSGLEGRRNKSYKWIREKHARCLSWRIKTTWAKKRGFDGYMQQCYALWSMFEETLSVATVSKNTGIPVNNINQCLKFLAEVENRNLSELRFKAKSIISKETRKNITKEQEEKRILATKAADYSNRPCWWTERGVKNPGKTNWKDTDVVTCDVCGKTANYSPGFRRWHFDKCRGKI